MYKYCTMKVLFHLMGLKVPKYGTLNSVSCSGDVMILTLTGVKLKRKKECFSNAVFSLEGEQQVA